LGLRDHGGLIHHGAQGPRLMVVMTPMINKQVKVEVANIDKLPAAPAA
jgi:hypothetical protein